ncbi:two-component sensor histidine kinase/CheY-like chemotaxis protein [Neorhizobium galegae]|uniref:sensor histidine kinase n=1 Tax=Neorhizobium galegae TaxID=399 RepID=UPI001AE28704|nr:HWE histidine kinase domain-containing protein [Neorhizobium galegae]MBP2550535.1 two-component sensor histidine kinase/CheY-like chemotaxis protein [Neorhizobium galegae]
MPRSDHAARILLLEDSALDAELIREHLERMEPLPAIHRAARRADYVEALSTMEFDVILADYSLPDFDGMAALELAHERVPEIPFIFVSGVLGEEAAIESFRRGATDYVLKQRLIRLAAAVERALSEARERAERRRVEEHRELLVRELSHRVKNTMAMVMSIVRRTARTAHTIDDYVENLMGRLRAMADAHALLFETNWNEADLNDMIVRTAAAYRLDGGRIEMVPGPLTLLDPRAALSVSLVLNELMTNAVKYGALSNHEGHVRIGWSQEKDAKGKPMLLLSWCETGGPVVTPPHDKGFGMTLIQRTIEYELLGTVSISYPQTGLVCDISFPLERTGEPILGPAMAAEAPDGIRDGRV